MFFRIKQFLVILNLRKSYLLFANQKSRMGRREGISPMKNNSNQSPRFLISACLVGVKCRYDGRSQERPAMQKLFESGQAIALCPEELANLGTPRPPCERRGEKVIDSCGNDRSLEFNRGVRLAIEQIKDLPLEGAYLKSKSPMCGYGQIYDGSFSGQLKQGKGVFAEALEKEGLSIIAVD